MSALAADAETATNQALRFANALRWERGQRKECEAREQTKDAELTKSKALNKKLTAELQATSELLNSAAKAAELLQKEKARTKQLEARLAQADQGQTKTADAGVVRSDEYEMLLAAMQRKQQEMDALREQLTTSAEENALLRAAAERPNVEVKSPFKMDPAGLLRGSSSSRLRDSTAGDPVIQTLWTDDASESVAAPGAEPPRRKPLGSLDGNNNATMPGWEPAKAKTTQPRVGRGCTCGGCTMDDAGNFRLQCSLATSAPQQDEAIIDLGSDEEPADDEEEDGGLPAVDGEEDVLDLARAEENAENFDAAASKSGFGDGPVPGGHAPYYCTSLDCDLAVVKQLAWEGGDADIAGQDEEAPAGCGRVLEGQLRFDSARYGAALDIIFTGSIEHLRDQEWQSDKDVTHCGCCEAEFGLLNRRHHCRVCGSIFCSDCLLRSLPYFVPTEDEKQEQAAASPGSDYRSSLALTVCDQDAEVAGTCPGVVKRAAILSCHTCFAMLQMLAVAQHGPEQSGLRFSMSHAGEA